jgi:septum site-determining protein MinC
LQLDGAVVADAVIAAPPALEPPRPAAVLRGTARGLEIHVDGAAAIEAVCAAILDRLEEAPSFFRGSDVRIKVEDGPLAAGALAQLDGLATGYDLRIVEVAAAKKSAGRDEDAVPTPNLAAGSAPSPASTEAPAEGSQPLALAGGDLVEAIEEPTQIAIPLEMRSNGTRLVIGPVRSGVILEHPGHLIVFGDVNPGAEVRAQGNIVVLGRLRGTAHAGIGGDVGFILALHLEPQQLRIGRKVARAADSDTPAAEPEIAHCTGDAIIVERYLGKLPKNLASSL